jgi:cytochrome c
MRYIQSVVFSVLASIVLLFSGPALADASKADAQAMVEKASAFLKANGKDKFISEVNTKNGQFHKGELYVYVMDPQGTLLANPFNVQQVGQNNVNQPDPEGKLFRKEIIELGNSKGSGWVDYKFKNPVSGKVEPKTAYVQKTNDVIIIAGVYQK